MLVELLLLIYENDEKKKNGLGNILPSAVPSPASTIKKFELQGKISLRQLLLLWQCLDDLNNLYAVVDPKKANKPRIPRTIEEVLQDEF
ncbi:hypothetical protein [Proteus mirabilis]|uniref:hypothetical protein n=1 Tax=Proteus mirabilis TaxID=584 RepID=UPI001EFA2020|nr:hypothetical protein [Proteus mirabilis]